MFSQAVEDALRVALEAHDGQVRKGLGTVPYVTHPFHVALMLARWAQDDAVIQAALLHDVVEDSESWTVQRLEERFGPRVARVVEELSEDKSEPWEVRKRTAVQGIARLSPEAAVVKALDKLHNLETLLADLRTVDDPDEVWRRFRGGREGSLSAAQELVEQLERRVDPRIARALRSALDRLLAFERNSAPA